MNMKRINIIMVMLLVVANQLLAQIVQENEAAVVYYMPKTELVVTLHYDCVTQQPGMFYQYAQRYLGATDIITESQTTYHLTHLALSTQTVADTQRAYKVTAEKGYKLQLLSLNQDGILLGYNMSKPVSASSPAPHSITTAHPTSYTTPVLPLLEEQFMASSIAKMAEGAAKQIYRIRETRLNILAGDVEHVPADGQAMQLVLDELAKQEQALVELFIGTTQVTQHIHQVTYTPQESVEQYVVCRFSKYAGVVSSEDLSGEPIYLNLVANRQTQDVASLEAKGLPSQICYNLPGSADINLTYKTQTIVKQLPIAQLGVSVPLPQDFFVGKTLPTIHFNFDTGNILSIQQ